MPEEIEMRAARCHETRGIDGVVVETVAMPDIAADEVLVRIEAAGLNFADRLMTRGEYQVRQRTPFTLGLEFAGTVERVGGSVGGFTIGDPVIAVTDGGGFAEFAAVKASQVVRRPASMPADVAASMAINYGTAHGAFAWKAELSEKDIVLVHGAAGGTGLAAVECAKAMGARVIATARGEARAAIASRHGADIALDSERPDLLDAIKRAADPQGGDGRVSVVFDTIGGPLFDVSLRSLAFSGRYLVIGFAGGVVPKAPANILLVKNADFMGFYWGSYRDRQNDLWKSGLRWVMDEWVAGRLRPVVEHRFALEDVKEAMEFLASRRATGKVVIVPK